MKSASDDLLVDFSEDTVGRRAFALDTARHLSIAGGIVGAVVMDRWGNWKSAAVRDSMRMIGEFRPQVILSACPIAETLMIGAKLLHRIGLIRIADFSDPLVEGAFLADLLIWKCYKAMEEQTLRKASLGAV